MTSLHATHTKTHINLLLSAEAFLGQRLLLARRSKFDGNPIPPYWAKIIWTLIEDVIIAQSDLIYQNMLFRKCLSQKYIVKKIPSVPHTLG